MPANPIATSPQDDFSCVALLESERGTELHLRDADGRLLRVPLGAREHLRGLAALAAIAGAVDFAQGAVLGGR